MKKRDKHPQKIFITLLLQLKKISDYIVIPLFLQPPLVVLWHL